MGLVKEGILSLKLSGFAEAEASAQRIAAYMSAIGQNAQGATGALGGLSGAVTNSAGAFASMAQVSAQQFGSLGAEVTRVAERVKATISDLSAMPSEVAISVTATRQLAVETAKVSSHMATAKGHAGGLRTELRHGAHFASLLFAAAGGVGEGLLGSALQGAAVGASFGPMGAVAGGVLGLAQEAFKDSRKEEKDESKKTHIENHTEIHNHIEIKSADARHAAEEAMHAVEEAITRRRSDITAATRAARTSGSSGDGSFLGLTR